MSKSEQQFKQSQQYLIALAQQQRLNLAQALQPWQKPLSVVDRIFVTLDTIRRHPIFSMAIYYGLRQLKLGQYWHWACLAFMGKNKTH